MDLIEIFKTGVHTDSAGRTREWTEKDLEEIASLYNPEVHEAPIVIGHPEHDSPAYGWVEGLKVEGGKLLAKVRDVADEFKDWVRRGLYKKVSIALYPDLSLRHVGFLGAMPPAVKGLKQATFGDKQIAWEIETDFRYMDYWQQEAVKNIFQRLRDWIIDLSAVLAQAGRFGLEEADRIISPYEIEALKAEPPPPEGLLTQSFSSDKPHKKGGKKMDLGKFLADLKALIVGAEKELIPDDPGRKFTEADVQAKINEEKEKAYAIAEKERKEKLELQTKLRAIESQRRRDEIHAFCEGLAKEGKLIPAWQKMGIEEFLFNLDDEPITFAENIEKSRSQWFKDFLAELPRVVTFKEVAGGSGPLTGDEESQKKQLISQYMEKNRSATYKEAVLAVSKEHPELFKNR